MAFLVARSGDQEIIINDDNADLSDILNPGGGSSGSADVAAALAYVASSIATVAIDNNSADTTLLGSLATDSSLVIPANTWLAGEAYVGFAGGRYKGKSTTPGKLKWTLKLGSELAAAIEPTLPPTTPLYYAWHMSWNLVRRSTGGSGTIVGQVRLEVENLTSGALFYNITTPLTLPSDADKTWDLTGDFVTANAENEVEQTYFVVNKIGKPAA